MTAKLNLTSIQLGTHATASNNFVIKQPDVPNGSLLIQNGNDGSATTLATFKSNGNLSIGIDHSAWNVGAGNQYIQMIGGSLYGGNTTIRLVQNMYNVAGVNDYYVTTGPASRYAQESGVHSWLIAPSGTAGTAIPWTTAMTLAGGATAPSLEIGHGTASELSNAKVVLRKYDNNNGTGQVFAYFQINGAGTPSGCGQINANGASQAAFGSYSDRRLKENIADLPSQLGKFMALRPVEFDYIESEGGGHQIGFVAQEVQEQFPDVVGERADGMLTVTGMGKFEARLIKAIQELSAKNDTLEARLAILEGAK